MIEGGDVLNGSKELLADKIEDCYSLNDYVIMELLNNDTIILVDCNNNFKYSKFDNLYSLYIIGFIETPSTVLYVLTSGF